MSPASEKAAEARETFCLSGGGWEVEGERCERRKRSAEVDQKEEKRQFF